MESAAVLRSFNCTVLNVRSSSLEKPCAFVVRSIATWSTTSRCSVQGFSVGRKLLSSVKAATSASVTKSDDMSALEKNSQQSATFPSGFQTLILGVCDETQIAELKIKVGDFQMHLKRNIEAPIPISYPVSPSPVPSKPVVESSAAAPASSPPKTSPGKVNPFTNVPVEKSRKLAALEASGASGYVLVASPTVGSFRKGRTLKGKKQPPICKEGDLIKEGQVIGFLDQFGTELPFKSDVAGEVLKLLFDDGEAVGYGDPLIAVLPSFHGIK